MHDGVDLLRSFALGEEMAIPDPEDQPVKQYGRFLDNLDKLVQRALCRLALGLRADTSRVNFDGDTGRRRAKCHGARRVDRQHRE
jgi:hypothetical protein